MGGTEASFNVPGTEGQNTDINTPDPNITKFLSSSAGAGFSSDDVSAGGVFHNPAAMAAYNAWIVQPDPSSEGHDAYNASILQHGLGRQNTILVDPSTETPTLLSSRSK